MGTNLHCAWPFLRAAGLAGPLVLAAGVMVPAATYTGRRGEPFSPLNHFVSELGEVGVSSLAGLFNGSLVVSGVLLAAFLGALGHRLGTRLARLAALAGVVAGLGASVVGLIPMNDLAPHLRAAFTFFDGGLVAVVLFTAALVRDRGRVVPRWLAVPGALSVLSFAGFLAWPVLFGPPDVRALDPASGVPRPDVWGTAAWEWAVLVSVLAFVACGAAATAPGRFPAREGPAVRH